MIESEIQSQIRLEAARQGLILFRNNVGLGWVGRLISNIRGRVIIENARPLHAGLCDGSSDLIGWTSVEITPEMVGRTMAIFTAVEVKTKTGRASEAQKNFLGVVTKAGGLAILGRDPKTISVMLSNWKSRA